MTNDPNLNTYRADRPGIRKVLGDLEAEIMEIIWTRPADQGTSVRDVFTVLYERRHLAYTTVMSTMARLAKKNLLRTEKQEQAYIYYPNFTQEEFVHRFVRRVLQDLLVAFKGATLEEVNALPDPQTAARARQLLDEITQRRAREDE